MPNTDKPAVYTGPDRRTKDQEMQILKSQVDDLNNKVVKLVASNDELVKSIAGLVEAWNTAQGVTKFVKWLSTLVAGAIALYLAAKGTK